MAWRKTLAVLTLIAILIGLVGPTLAQARNYGGFTPTEGAYQADWRPFNDGRFTEITNFSCVMSDGRFLGPDRQKVLGDILEIGGKIYGGSLEVGDFRGGDLDFGESDDSDPERPYDEGLIEGTINDAEATATFGFGGDDIPAAEQDFREEFESQEKYENLGYETGKPGLRDYLNDVRSSLMRGDWAWSKETAIRAPGYEGSKEWTPNSRVLIFDTGENRGEREVAPKAQRVMAKLINTNAYAPIDSFKIGGRDGLPPGCPIEPFDPGDNIGLGDIINDFDGSFTTLLFSPITKLVQGTYGWVSPLAMKYSFWTAHTERGDLPWSVPDSCSTKAQAGVVKGSAADGCKGGEALGYSKRNLDVDNQGEGSGVFIKLAAFLKWLLSGTYMLIIFAAAALFIVRGNANTNFNLLKLLPRLLLSMVLLLMLPFFMGLAITFSNSLVQTFFGSEDGELIAQINLILSQSGVVIGGGEFFERLINTIVGGFSTWYMLLLFIIAIARAIALIVLVVVAPIAAFALISDSWRPFFMKWLKAFLAVTFIPALLALLLKMGVMINPLYGDAAAEAYGTMAGTLGVILMVVILYAMTKVARAAKDFAIGQSSMATGAMSGFGSGLAAAGAATGNSHLANLGSRLGQRAQNSASQASAQAASGSLIPQGRGTAAGAGLSGAAGGALGWVERGRAKALAQGGLNEIDESSYFQNLAEQNAIGKESFHQQYGFTVEKRGKSFYRNFSTPAPDANSGPATVDMSRKKKVRRAKGSFDATSIRHASRRSSSGAPPTRYSRPSTGGALSASARPNSAPSPAQPRSESRPSSSGGVVQPANTAPAADRLDSGQTSKGGVILPKGSSSEDQKEAAALDSARRRAATKERRSERRE